MWNTRLVYSLVFWACILLFGKEVSSSSCFLKDYGSDRKVCVCNSTYCDTIERLPAINKDEYVAFVSSKEGLRFQKFTGKFSQGSLQQKKNFLDSIFTGKDEVEITVNTSIRFQKFTGFGGTFTDAAGINILSLKKEAQDHLMRSYFSENGIEYNIGKVPIAATDFSTRPYSYDDGAEDVFLEHFSLTNEDFQFKIPLIKKAKALSTKDVHLLSTSWSPPIWMKTNNNWFGSSALKPEHYITYANYILKFLDMYRKEDIKFWAVSAGNEPIHGVKSSARSSSLGWTAETLAHWTSTFFGPKLRNSTHNDVLLLTFDDQEKYLPGYIEKTIKSDPKVYHYIDGFAVHWYSDSTIKDDVLKNLHKEYPDKFILYTQASNGDKVLIGDWDRGEKYILEIIKNLNAWAVGWIDWNLALSVTGGPSWPGNFVDSPILVNATAGEFYKQPMFYAMGHVSKFIDRDATKIQVSPTDNSGIAATAVQNPDGRVVIVLVNKNNKPFTISTKVDNRGWIDFILPKNSFTTILC